MRGSGRAPPSGFSILTRLLYLSAKLALATSTDYGIPIEIKLWDTGRTPLAHMVDVTNGFGLKVLAEHNFLNDNNIAFSPYGLMGILVALYEGVDGESSFQIQRGMQLPWNRNVMRIGFRDIHRTLKTYFIPEEGFLAGLALNNENVTFNESYKKILRFYGFELENDLLPTFPPGSNDTTNGTATNETITTVATTASAATTPATPVASVTTANTANREELSTTPVREETTSNPNAETIGEVDLREPTSTTISSAVSNVESTTSISVNPSIAEQDPTITEQVITSSQTVTPTQIGTTTQIIETVQAVTTPLVTTLEQAATTAQVVTAEQLTTAATNTITEQTTTIEQTATTLEQAVTLSPVTTPEQATSTITLTTTSVTATVAEISPATTTVQLSSTSAATETVAEQAPSTVTLTDEPTANNEIDAMTTREVTNLAESTVTDPSTTTTNGIIETESTTTGTTEQLSTMDTDSSTATETESTTASTLETLERRKRSVVDFIFTNPPYVDDYLVYKSYDIGGELPPIDFDDKNKMFLVNGLRHVQVTYMRYDTILEYAYLPHLEASALRLPLDSDRYYLLVVLPTRGSVSELGRLLSRMARESDLSDIYASLRPRRVRALVPSFTVKGHVTLTTDLQKLGIRDVFEPRQHDFTPMTHQAGVYVRSIEQAVSVAIRKYRPDEQKKNRYVNNRHPVMFKATYPFLYFVMDASIHVALMAGKMVDPLNTRIL